MDERIKERVEKDMTLFYKSIKELDKVPHWQEDKKIAYIVKLSDMYAKDAKSYMEKNDLCTAFSCISYAHGLLDAVKEITGVGIEGA